MRSLIYSMNISLDGYIADPAGGLEWTGEDPELLRFVTEETRQLSAYVMGRRLYETMVYWETAIHDPSLDDAGRAWAEVWNPLPKVVFSTTLSAVEGRARLATGTLAEEIEWLRTQGGGDGPIAIGGATLAAAAADLDLIDEYRPRIHPVLLGGGTPFFPRADRRVDLELLERRDFPSQAVAARYRVAGEGRRPAASD